jgi:hypothetical protein
MAHNIEISSLKYLGPKTQFCLPIYIYLLFFISQLIKEKSGKVGQNGWNRCNHWVSAGPVLKIKVGQSPKKVGQNLFSSGQISSKPK